MLGASQVGLLGLLRESGGGDSFVPTVWDSTFSKQIAADTQVVSDRITLTNNNLTFTHNTTGWCSARSLHGVSSGKWRFRINVDSLYPSSAYCMVGIAPGIFGNNNTSAVHSAGNSAVVYYSSNGNKYINGSVAAYGGSFTTGNYIDCIVDLDNGKVWFAKNGVVQASGNPVTGANPANGTLLPAGSKWYAVVGLYNSGDSVTANFGASSFNDSGYTGFTDGFGDNTVANGTYCNFVTTGGHPTGIVFHSYYNSGKRGSSSVFSPKGDIFKSSGKWYWEFRNFYNVSTSRYGIATSSHGLTSACGSDANSYGFGNSSTNLNLYYNNGVVATLSGYAVAIANVIMMALDLDSGKIWIGKSGVWYNNGDPANGTNPTYTGISGSFTPCMSNNTSMAGCIYNSGRFGFTYTPPSGYLPITA